jgi:hypothetical protein
MGPQTQPPQTHIGAFFDYLEERYEFDRPAMARWLGISAPELDFLRLNGLPREDILLWLERLRLAPEESQAFIHLASLDHTPAVIRAYLANLETEIRQLREQVRVASPQASDPLITINQALADEAARCRQEVDWSDLTELIAELDPPFISPPQITT